MIFKGLDNKEYKANLSKYKKKKGGSKLHLKARELIHDLFPCFVTLEEVRCFGSKKPGKIDLFIDFIILELNIAIEVQGKQHFEYTPFYHKDKFDFLAQKKRDSEKLSWCSLNNLELIYFRYDESIDDWKTKITRN